MHNSLRIDLDHEERKDGPKPNIVGLQEIAGPYRMVLQKGSPSLAARKVGRSGLGHVSLDRAFCDSNSKLQEFATYSLGAPKDIFGSHAVNECDDFRVNTRKWALDIPRLPTPEEPKSLAVPSKHRVGFHEQQGVPPMRQKAREQDDDASFMGFENRTFDLSRCDDELLAK